MLSEKPDGKMAKAGLLTPAVVCKQHGTTLKALSEATKQSRQTLDNWFKYKPELFRICIYGVLYSQDKEG